MLTHDELLVWQSRRSYPSVSILAPMHRTAPANKKDRIKVKNLVNKAVDRLHGEFSKREVAPVVKNLLQLVKQVDWQHTLDGLALFASAEHAAGFSLPFKVKPRAMIDETFATRDLVYALNRAPAYQVLALGHQCRLFDAWTTVLDEYLTPPFPMIHRGPGGTAKLPGGKGINISAKRDEASRAFFRTVDEALGKVRKDASLPLVVVGVERNLAFFQEVTKHDGSIVGMLAGNHERTSPSDLGKLVWPVLDAGATQRRTQALVRLDDAVSANRHASGIDQVWQAVAQSRVSMLLVEKEFKYPADISPEGDRLIRYSGMGASALDDAVDEVIELVLRAGGEVFFYGSGDLDVHQRIAAVLRY